MKFEYRLVNLNNIIDKEVSEVQKFLRFYGVKKFDENDIISMQKIANEISEKNRADFNVSYIIPRLDKEFDLVKIGTNKIINIELKKTNYDTNQCITNYKILKNTYQEYSLHCFCYITNSNKLYELNFEPEVLKECNFTYLNELLNDINKGELLNINFEISPIYSQSTFSYEKINLSDWQSNALLAVLRSSHKVNIITGRPGSGKSTFALYLYDYFKELERKNTCYIVPFMMYDIINRNLIKEKQINTVRSFLKKTEKYDICIIDEAQRLSKQDFEELQKRTNYKMILIGDINQNIDDECFFEKLYSQREKYNILNMNGVIRSDDTFDCYARKILDIPRKGIKNKVIDKSKIKIIMFDEFDLDEAKKYVYIEPSKSKYFSDCREECKNQMCCFIASHCSEKLITHTVVSSEFENVLLYLCNGFKIVDGKITKNRKVCYREITSHLYSIITRTTNKLLIVTDNIEMFNYLMKCLEEM